MAVGLIGFLAPFFGCVAVAYWALNWGPQQSWLAGGKVVLADMPCATLWTSHVI